MSCATTYCIWQKLLIKIVVFLSLIISAQICQAEGVQSNNPDDIRFYLYSTPELYTELVFNNIASIANSKFCKEEGALTIVLSHGFTQNFTSSFPQLLKNAYLTSKYMSKNINVITVDWGLLSSPRRSSDSLVTPFSATLSKLLAYKQAARNVPIVGTRVGEFLVFLNHNGFLPSEKFIHLVGHSLGAHVSGFAGKYYKSTVGVNVGRITGTDPARPEFQGKPIEFRLAASDADFVDVIHTNAGEFGYVGPLGQLDFFVNGGGPEQQPECESQGSPSCSHDMSYKYFTESIFVKTILGCPCPPTSCFEAESIIFGEFAPPNASGSYCLRMDLSERFGNYDGMLGGQQQQGSASPFKSVLGKLEEKFISSMH